MKSRCRRKRSSSDNESADRVMQVFTWSPKKSVRKCYPEIGVKKTSVHQILRGQKWKPFIPKLVHTLNEYDPDRRRQFFEREIAFYSGYTPIWHILYIKAYFTEFNFYARTID